MHRCFRLVSNVPLWLAGWSGAAASAGPSLPTQSAAAGAAVRPPPVEHRGCSPHAELELVPQPTSQLEFSTLHAGIETLFT